jgi:hypothetical protein
LRAKLPPSDHPGSKAVQSEQGSAAENNVANLHDAGQADQLRFVDFGPTEQFDVVSKVAQEPVELPEGSGIAIESAVGNDVAGKSPSLQNGAEAGSDVLPSVPKM